MQTFAFREVGGDMAGRRWRYTRKDEVEVFIKENPGVTRAEVEKHFQSKVRATIRKLLKEGRVYLEKDEEYRYYWKG